MRLPKPLYDIGIDEVGWVLSFSDKEKKKAYDIWRKRESRLMDALMKIGFAHGWRFDLLVRLTGELYERMCAIKYPSSVKHIISPYENPQQKSKWGIKTNIQLPDEFKEKYFKKDFAV